MIALPGCDLVDAAAAEIEALAGGEAEAEPAAVEAAWSEQTPAAEPAPAPTPTEAPAEIAAVPEGLGSELRSTIERARIGATAEPSPDDPTVVVPFSADPSRVEPIRPRAKTPEVRVRPRVRPRRVVEPVAPVAIAPIAVVEPPRMGEFCPACGRG